MSEPTAYVYAVWALTNAEWQQVLRDEDTPLDTFHVSAGSDDNHQEDGYFPSDPDSQLTFAWLNSEWVITFKSPSKGIETNPNYWLSPNPVLGTIDAGDFGIRKSEEVTS